MLSFYLKCPIRNFKSHIDKMKKGYKYNYGGMPQKPTGTKQPVNLDAIIKKNMQKFQGGGQPTPWADYVANSFRPNQSVTLSPTQQKVMKTISNLPVYSPDARFADYQDALPYWQDNVAFTPVMQDKSNFGPDNSPSVGSYFSTGTPSPYADAWRSGNTYVNPSLFNKYDNEGNVVEHETFHAGFNGRDVPQWMIDNLNRSNRNPGSGEHENMINEQLVNQAIARQSVLDEFGLQDNATIPQNLSDEYLRRGMYSAMRNPNAPAYKTSVREAISGNKPGSFNNLVNYRKNGGDISLPNVYPNQMVSKYGPGGQTTDGCPAWHVRVNSDCVSIYSDEYKKLYAQGLTAINGRDGKPVYLTPDIAKSVNLPNVSINAKTKGWNMSPMVMTPTTDMVGMGVPNIRQQIQTDLDIKAQQERDLKASMYESGRRANEASFSSSTIPTSGPEADKQEEYRRQRNREIAASDPSKYKYNYDTGDLVIIETASPSELRDASFIHTPQFSTTMGSFSGVKNFNDMTAPGGAGNIGATTMVNMLPGTGQFLSGARLYDFARVPKNNQYFNPNNGTFENIMGGIGLLGDVANIYGGFKMSPQNVGNVADDITAITGVPKRNDINIFTSKQNTPYTAKPITTQAGTLAMTEEELAEAMAEIENANIPAEDLEFNYNPTEEQIQERTRLKNLFNKIDDPDAPEITADDYKEILRKQELEKQRAEQIRAKQAFQNDPISQVTNSRGLVTPGYKSFVEGPFWEQNKADIYKLVQEESIDAHNAALKKFVNDAKTFKNNVVDVNNVSEAKSQLYQNIEQLVKENAWRQAFPENTDVNTGNQISDAIMGFLKNEMTLTDKEAMDLFDNYNPSNPFANWSDARVKTAIDLINRQRLASGILNPGDVNLNIGADKLPRFGYYTYAEKNPIENLAKGSMYDLSNSDKALVSNQPGWMENTISKGKWKDVGMEMRGVMKSMGFDPTNEGDVLRFVDRFKDKQNQRALDNYSGVPDIRQLFGTMSHNKYGGPLQQFYKGRMTGPNMFEKGGLVKYQKAGQVNIDGKMYDKDSEEYRDLYNYGPNMASANGGIGYFDNAGRLVSSHTTLPEVVVFKKNKGFKDLYDNLDDDGRYALEQITKKHGSSNVFFKKPSGIYKDAVGTYNSTGNNIRIDSKYKDNPGASLGIYLSELAHKMQYDKQGAFDVNGTWIFNDLPDYIMGNSPYDNPNAMEYKAHQFYEPQLSDELDEYYNESALKNNYNKFKDGGNMITDPRGQWAHPGKNTRIPGGNITMQGVNYPVLAKANNGMSTMMYPGQDYNFPGASYVDEYPLKKKYIDLDKAQVGLQKPTTGDTIHLNQLTNQYIELFNSRGKKNSVPSKPSSTLKENFSDYIKKGGKAYKHKKPVHRSQIGKELQSIHNKQQEIQKFALEKGISPTSKKRVNQQSTYYDQNGMSTEFLETPNEGPYVDIYPTPVQTTPAVQQQNSTPVVTQPIPQGHYRVEYFDPQLNQETHRMFMTQAESDAFTKELGQRNLSGVPAVGNITQRYEQRFGGLIEAQFGYQTKKKYPIDLHLPKYEQPKPFFTGYGFSVRPVPNVDVHGVGLYGQGSVNDRLNLSGNVNSASVFYPGGNKMFMNPRFEVGMKYRFQEGGEENVVEKSKKAMLDFYNSRPENINNPNVPGYIDDITFKERGPRYMNIFQGGAMGYYNPFTNVIGYNPDYPVADGYGDLQSTIEHEIGHDIYEYLNEDMRNIIKQSVLPASEIRTNMLLNDDRKGRKFARYLGRPTEFYTRRNSLFDTFGFDPSQPLTREQAQSLVDLNNQINSTYTPDRDIKEARKEFSEKYPGSLPLLDKLNDSKNRGETIEFMNSIKNDPETYLRMFNDVTAIPGQQTPVARYGGGLDQYQTKGEVTNTDNKPYLPYRIDYTDPKTGKHESRWFEDEEASRYFFDNRASELVGVQGVQGYYEKPPGKKRSPSPTEQQRLKDQAELKGTTKSFYNQWYNSPMHAQMLKASLRKPFGTGLFLNKRVKQKTQDRLNSINNEMDLNLQPYPEAIFDMSSAGHVNTGNPSLIQISPFSLLEDQKGTSIHEGAHVTDLLTGIPRKDTKKMQRYADYNTVFNSGNEYFTEDPNSQEFKQYVGKDTEGRARVMQGKYILSEIGSQFGYDPFTQKLSKDQFYKAEQLSPEFKRINNELRSIYSEDEILDLHNTLSKSNNNQSQTMARNGGALEQYQVAGQVGFNQPTRGDSTDLLQNVLRVNNYYNNTGNYTKKNEEFGRNLLREEYSGNPIVTAKTAETLDLDGFNYRNNTDQITYPTASGKKSIGHIPKDSYYKNIDKNKFYKRESAMGILDTRAPMMLFDRRIEPTSHISYENTNKKNILYGDMVHIFHYDPISITPWDMLKPKQQQERLKKYGTKGTPYDPALKPKLKEKPKVNVKPKSEPELHLTPFVPATKIPIPQPTMNFQIQERIFPKLDIPNVNMSGPYMVGYHDYSTGEGVDRGFATAEERDAFYKQLSERQAGNYQPGQGNISSYYDVNKRNKKYGGGLLSKTVTCSNCGWSWKAVDGGEDVMTCHKCGGMIKMKQGGVASNKGYYNVGMGVPRFDVGGEPCYDAQGNVIPCDEKRLKELGSDAFTAMQPFYETVFEAGNKYANSETGVTSRLNSLRATMKGLIKHPEVMFMKRHQLPSELISMDANKNPYHVQGYTTAGSRPWQPTDWAEPRREYNTEGGWQNFKMKLKENAEERKGRRDRGKTGCWGTNCTENEIQDQARYGGVPRFNIGGNAEKICYDENGFRVPCADEAVPIEYTFDKNDPNLRKYQKIKDTEKQYINNVNSAIKIFNSNNGILSEKQAEEQLSNLIMSDDFSADVDKYGVQLPNGKYVGSVNEKEGVTMYEDGYDFPVEKEYRFLDPSNMHVVYGPSQSIIGFTKSNGDFYPVNGTGYATKKEDLEFLKNQHALDVYLGERSLHRANTKKYGGAFKFDGGGQLVPTCPTGQHYDQNLKKCVSDFSQSEFLINMANSKLFPQRYATMTNRPLNEIDPAEIQEYKNSILNNLKTVKYAPPGVSTKDDPNWEQALGSYEHDPDLKNITKQMTDFYNGLDKESKKNKEIMTRYSGAMDKLKKLEENDHIIYMNKNATPSTVLHEESHSTTRANENLKFAAKPFTLSPNSSLYEELSKNKKYYEDPSELKARRDAIGKFMLDKKLWDPYNEPFTEETYDKLIGEYHRIIADVEKGDPEYELISDMLPIMDGFSKEEVVRMFNSFVKNNNTTSQTTAKYGGSLLKDFYQQRVKHGGSILPKPKRF